MTTEPFLSIVTVTLNNLAGLQKTKTSIDFQSCRDFEWIVVDGGSSDATPTFLKTLDAKTVCETDRGIYDAMNKGIKLSSGRYVIFMNAGDLFSDADILAAIKRASILDDPDFIYGDALESNGLYKKARDVSNLVSGMPTHHQAMLYRRQAISAPYSLQYDIASDYDFTVRFLLKNPKIHYMLCAICVFEDGGISQRRRTRGRREQFVIRRSGKICGSVTNAFIYLLQTVSAALRENLPALYFALRGR